MNQRLTLALLLFCAPIGCGKDTTPGTGPDAGVADLAAPSGDLAGAAGGPVLRDDLGRGARDGGRARIRNAEIAHKAGHASVRSLIG